MSKLNTFKFEVWEHWFGGITHKFYEVKAAHVRSAEKRIQQLKGNRTWETKLVDSRPGVDGDWFGGFYRSVGGAE